ncbi:nicotinate (nicotinamide) nucleotide adenylyltransferase [Chromatiales bacterium (ex Bugula neritina AB1)]|nr:nicotinate (nicotinamide) nucleotide adenylyltransferase [Chromatiales bacterium (ex Bugula neritina AB1)]
MVCLNPDAKKIGVYGGSFDPVHNGHLRSAQEVMQLCNLDELRFVPSGNPPHRSRALVSAVHRRAMLKLAVADVPGMVIDTRELERTQPSYSIDTLESIRAEVPHASLVLIIGMDQFSAFDTWHRWQELLQRVDLAVLERPGETISAHARELLKGALAERISVLKVTQLEISSSRIRHDLSQGLEIRFLVPYAVRNYIRENRLYASNVSMISTHSKNTGNTQ